MSDPEYAAAYLEECLAYNDPSMFLRALREVVQAQTNMSNMARHLKASRPQLYASLSEKGNPEFKTLVGVLNSLGLRLSVAPLNKTA